MATNILGRRALGAGGAGTCATNHPVATLVYRIEVARRRRVAAQMKQQVSHADHPKEWVQSNEGITMPTQIVTPSVLPVNHNLSRFLAGFGLSAVAVLGHMSPAHADQAAARFGPPDPTHPSIYIDCSTASCDSRDQRTILGNQAFAIPLAGADPCNNPGGNGKSHWMQAGMAFRTSPTGANCDPAPEVVNGDGETRTYWTASLPATFTDVLFVEELHAMLLARFPKLNANRVYATGFSSGGGMTYMLACYRASLFRGFSVVAKTLGSDSACGDYDKDGIIDIDPESLVATCGKNEWAAGHAAGITAPEVWGTGTEEVVLQLPWGGQVAVVPIFRRKPVALFVGDQGAATATIS